MVSEGYELSRYVRVETLRALQQRFSRLGQVTVAICYPDGQPVAAPSWGSRYSEIIGTSRKGRTAFRKALLALVRDPRIDVPSICHDGMTLYAVEIRHKRKKLAVLVVGTRAPGFIPEELVRQTARRFEVPFDDLSVAALPEHDWTGGTPDAIHEFADVLAEVIATLYEQAHVIGARLADLRVVQGVSELLAGTESLEEMLQTLVQQVVGLFGVKASAVRLLDEVTGDLVIKATHNLSEEYLRKGPVTIFQNAIDAKAFRGETVYIADAPNDPRTIYPENARREGIVSGLSVPMTFRGETVGVLRVYADRRKKFHDPERQLLRSVAAQAASAIVTSRLNQQQKRTETFNRQIAAAAAVQKRMLPEAPPASEHIELAGVYDPSLQLGGDFYDFFPFPGGIPGFAIADVVGKGLAAAMLMSNVRSSLRAFAKSEPDLGALVADVNEQICADTLPAEFATMYVCRFLQAGGGKAGSARRAQRNGEMEFCNAGHLPLVRCRDGKIDEYDVGGPLIGITPGETYEVGRCEAKSGDFFVLVTDGVTEALDFDGDMYGWSRLIDSIRRHADNTAEVIAQQIQWDVRRFAGLAEQSDDITAVVARIR